MKSDWLKELLKSTGGASGGDGEGAVEDEACEKQPATVAQSSYCSCAEALEPFYRTLRPAAACNKQCCTWQEQQSNDGILGDGLPERKDSHASLN